MIKGNGHGFHLFTVPLVIVIVMAVGCAGWYVYSSQKQNKIRNDPNWNLSSTIIMATPSPNTESTKDVNDVNNWHTYKNSFYHYSVKYPPYWEYVSTRGNGKDQVLVQENYDRTVENSLTIHVQEYGPLLEAFSKIFEMDNKSVDSISFEDFVTNYYYGNTGKKLSVEKINTYLGDAYFVTSSYKDYAIGGGLVYSHRGYIKDNRQQFYYLDFGNSTINIDMYVATYKLIMTTFAASE